MQIRDSILRYDRKECTHLRVYIFYHVRERESYFGTMRELNCFYLKQST